MNMVTPSAAHDSAYARPPEHDEMVADVYEHILKNGSPVSTEYHPDGAQGQSLPYLHRFVECESMFSGDKTFFADISVTSWADYKRERDRSSTRYFHYLILEIKPKIYSAGALLRQLKVQERCIEAWLSAQDGNSSAWGRSANQSCVIPVLKKDDPLLDTFWRMSLQNQKVLLWSEENGLELGRKVAQIKEAA